MPFSAPKMHFFDKNGNLTPWPPRASSDFKELLFLTVFALAVMQYAVGVSKFGVKLPPEKKVP